MTFTIYKASDFRFTDKVTFNTLEELKNYQLNAEVPLVIDFSENTITIYDGYLE